MRRHGRARPCRSNAVSITPCIVPSDVLSACGIAQNRSIGNASPDSIPAAAIARLSRAATTQKDERIKGVLDTQSGCSPRSRSNAMSIALSRNRVCTSTVALSIILSVARGATGAIAR
tara:strand:+ start:5962 stop:6315 length:354 start_codon:yes stop_codon:yes gene_type:complete